MKMLFCGKSLPCSISPGGRNRKGRRKERGTEFRQEAPPQSWDGFSRNGQGENGTAAAAHQRIKDLRLFAQPVLGRRQPWILRESGWFEIVAKRATGKSPARNALPGILRINFVRCV